MFLNVPVRNWGVLTIGGEHGFGYCGYYADCRWGRALGHQPLHSHGLLDQKHSEHCRRDRGRCLAIAGIRSDR